MPNSGQIPVTVLQGVIVSPLGEMSKCPFAGKSADWVCSDPGLEKRVAAIA
jgi:hypothetical protein